MTTKKLTLFALIGVIIIVSAVIIFSGNSQRESDKNLAAGIAPLSLDENGAMPIKTAENGGKTIVYFFWGDGCPHCEAQKPFLEEMEKKYPGLEVKSFETWRDQENAKLFQEVAKAYGIQARGVPTTFIGDFEPIVGFAEGMKTDMEDKIKTCVERGCVDPASKL